MTNGNMIDELREIASGDEKISQAQMNRLILSAVSSIYDKQERILCELEDMRETDLVERGKLQVSQHEIQDDIKKKWQELQNAQQRTEIHQRALENEVHQYMASHKVDSDKLCLTISKEVDLLKNNFFITAGTFISKHPKMTMTIVLLIFIVLNLWFISDTRKVILVLMGFPPNLLDWLPMSTPGTMP